MSCLVASIHVLLVQFVKIIAVGYPGSERMKQRLLVNDCGFGLRKAKIGHVMTP